MFGKSISPIDYGMALVGGGISRATVKYPPVAKFLQGTVDPKRLLQYRSTHVASNTVRGWVEFDGNKSAGIRPKNFPFVGYMAINLAKFSEAKSHYPERTLAVAWALGSTVMVAELPDANFEQPSYPGQEEKCIGMKVGKGALRMTCGLWIESSHEFVVPGGGVRHVGFVPAEMAATLNIGPIY